MSQVKADAQASASAKRAVPELYPFIESYSNRFQEIFGQRPGWRRTRVAILDSGILSIPPVQIDNDENKRLWPRIAEGESFIDNSTRLPPWQFASDPHGTQIANIVSAIDPQCEIYVGKVTEGRHGILPDKVAEVCVFPSSVHVAAFSVYMTAVSETPDRLLTWSSTSSRRRQAILWGRKRKVDIISMSFAIPQYYYHEEKYAEKLQDAVGKADTDDILQLCSHHDEGWNVSNSWPADCEYTKVIVACNEYGAFPDRQPSTYDYQIHGIDIFTGAVPYLESKETMSGSSVATAIAAGLASLVLSCHRLQLQSSEAEISRRGLVRAAFDKMSISKPDGKQKYLRLSNFSKFAKAKDENGRALFGWFE